MELRRFYVAWWLTCAVASAVLAWVLGRPEALAVTALLLIGALYVGKMKVGGDDR